MHVDVHVNLYVGRRTQKLAINLRATRAEPNGKWVKDSHRSRATARSGPFAKFLCKFHSIDIGSESSRVSVGSVELNRTPHHLLPLLGHFKVNAAAVRKKRGNCTEAEVAVAAAPAPSRTMMTSAALVSATLYSPLPVAPPCQEPNARRDSWRLNANVWHGRSIGSAAAVAFKNSYS